MHAWGDSLEKYATWMEQAGSNGVQRYEFGPMIHKGVEYSIARTLAPDVWKRQSRISGRIRSGQTEAQLPLLVMRRVQLRIDREPGDRERKDTGKTSPELR